MTALMVVGVDPGEITGIAALRFADGRCDAEWARIVQCSPNAVRFIVEAFTYDLGISQHIRTIIAVESFVVQRRATRAGSASSGQTARELIGGLVAFAVAADVQFVQRPAGGVKPWATDKRLAAARLFGVTERMPHARDGARHALFTAVHDGGIPDPLLRRKADA